MTHPEESRALVIDTDALANKALEMGSDGIDGLERVLAMAEREMDRRAEQAYTAAMLELQTVMPRVYKDGANKDNNSRFSKLEQVDRHIRPLYTEHGFTIHSFRTEAMDQPGWLMHVATVSHVAGASRDVRAPFPVDNKGPKGGPTKTEMHGVGSALTYAQRRLTLMAFNVVTSGEDDDGQAATERPPPEPVSQEQADTLRQHVLDLYVEPAKFLASYNTDTFAGIPKVDYHDAMQRIEARRAWLDDHPEKADALAAAIAKREADVADTFEEGS